MATLESGITSDLSISLGLPLALAEGTGKRGGERLDSPGGRSDTEKSVMSCQTAARRCFRNLVVIQTLESVAAGSKNLS